MVHSPDLYRSRRPSPSALRRHLAYQPNHLLHSQPHRRQCRPHDWSRPGSLRRRPDSGFRSRNGAAQSRFPV